MEAGLPLAELVADMLEAEGEVFLPRASVKEAAVGERGASRGGIHVEMWYITLLFVTFWFCR